MNPLPSLSKTRKASRISSSTSESLNSLGKRKTLNFKWLKPYLNILFSDLVISQTNSWKLMSPSPSWSRREGMMKYWKCFILTKWPFQASYLVDHIDHVLQLLLWRRPSKAGHHLVETIDKNSIAPKKLFWGGSSSWQLQDIVSDIKERKYKTQRFCVKHKDCQLTIKKERLFMKYRIY